MRIHVLDSESEAQAAALTSQKFKTAKSAQRKPSHIHVHVFICEQVLFVYVSTLIPPCLTDQRNFICTISNPGTGADDTFVLKRGVWCNATWPIHSRPAIAASARHFQICFLP